MPEGAHRDRRHRAGRSRAAANVRRKLIFAAALGAVAAALGCDQGTPALSYGGKGEAPQVVWKYPWTYTPTDDVGVEAIKVPTSTSIRVQFNRFLAPDSAVRQAICVQAASVGPGAPLDQCIGGLSPEYDPVDRVAVWKGASLLPNRRYNVRLLIPQNADDPTGVRAFDGVPLEAEYTFAFTTGDGTPAGTDPSFVEPDRTITFCSKSPFCSLPGDVCKAPVVNGTVLAPGALIQRDCSLAACHGTPSKDKNSTPVGATLTLVDPQGGVPAAIQRLANNATVASLTSTAADPNAPKRGPNAVFGQNMPYIDIKSPGNSFLVYKLILAMPPRCSNVNEESANPAFAAFSCTPTGGYVTEGFTGDQYHCNRFNPQPNPDGGCTSDAGVPPPLEDGGVPGKAGTRVPPLIPPWVPEDRWKPPANGEYARLRLRIRGEGMPPLTPTAYQNVLAISAWIAQGAPVSATCP